MSEVLQTNVFFVITSVAVVVFTIFLCILLYYAIGVARNIRDITDKVRRGTEQLAEDAMEVRSFVKDGIIGTVKRLVTGGSAPRPSRGRRKKEGDESEDEVVS